MITLLNIDCMEYMKDVPDKYFDLAIVDPPYGINIAKTGSLGCNIFKAKDWDSKIPSNEYFIKLKRISNNQIIWGANFFSAVWEIPCKEYIVWNKLNHHDNRADVEMAWTSFTGLAKYYEYMWDGNRYGKIGNIKGVGMPTIRIHPTQKPVQLYKWLLKNYSSKEHKIIDTHLGSGSSAIAAYDFGVKEFVGCEIDKEYFDAAVKRFNIHKMQQKLF